MLRHAHPGAVGSAMVDLVFGFFPLQGLCLQPHEHRRRWPPILGEGQVHQCLGDGGGSGRRCPARGRFLLSCGPDLQGPPQEHPRRRLTVRHRRAHTLLARPHIRFSSGVHPPPDPLISPRFWHSTYCMHELLAWACPGPCGNLAVTACAIKVLDDGGSADPGYAGLSGARGTATSPSVSTIAHLF